MIIENNNWFCTDPDCMQFCRQVSENIFEFIQAVLLNTYNDNMNNHAVCTGYVDLKCYSSNDIQYSIGSYGYTLESIKEIYAERTNQIIAECLFEDGYLYDNNSISGIISLCEAEKLIQKYIDETNSIYSR